MDDVLKCYKVLDLPPGATAEQIRKAYVELAHVWHPDRFPANPVLREQAREKMLEIDSAYKTLTGFLPVLRKDDTLDAAVPVEPEKVDDVIEITDSHVSMKYAIAGFLILVIAGLLIFAYAISFHGQSAPAPINYQ